MNFRHLAFIVFLSTYATGNVDAKLCVDSVLTFRETKNGQHQTCMDTKLTCEESPTVRSHCKEKCDLSYCCEDSKMSYLKVQTHKGQHLWKPCDKLKKYCAKIPDVASACPVTCKKCVPHSISDILQMIDSNAATNKAAFEEQGAINSEQGAINSEQGAINSELGAINSEQEITITGLKESVRDLESRYRFGDFEYVFASEAKLWADHNRAANEWGGHLASCHSNEESNFMMSLVRNTKSWVFIDGLRSDGTMFNTDGSAFDYLNWYNAQHGEPHGDIYMVMLPYKVPGKHDQDGMGIADYHIGDKLKAIYKREFKYL